MGTKTQGRMKCRYCNVALAPLRSLTDGEFCCDEHRQAFEGGGAHRGDGAPAAPEPAGDQFSYHTEQTASNDLHAMAQNLNAFDFQSSSRALRPSSPAAGSGVEFSGSAESNPVQEVSH